MVTKTLTGGTKLRAQLEKLARKADRSALLSVGYPVGAKYVDGTPVALVAAVQEFGAPSRGVPPRPTFRPMVAEGKTHWGSDVGKLLVIHDFDAVEALTDLGKIIADALREKIVELVEPALSETTLLLRERFWTNPEDITFRDVMQARRDIASGTQPKLTGNQAKPLLWSKTMINSIKATVDAK